jgi:predicted Zn-dependent protease
MLSDKSAQDLIARTLSKAKAEHVTVSVVEERSALTRFANNAITQNVSGVNLEVRIEAAFGQQKGVATVNAPDDAALGEAMARAEEIARLSPADPEYLPPPDPAKFPDIPRLVPATADATPELRATEAQRAIAICKGKQLVGAGFVSTETTARAIGNNRGLFGYQAASQATFSLTAARGTASGWVRRVAGDVTALGVEAAAGIATEKALKSENPAGWPAGKYTVILEPAAVAGALGPLGWGGMSAKETDEGRTFLAGKVGKKLVSERVVLESDPFHPGLVGRPWFAGGLPNRKVTWIDGGAFVNLSYDRFTAKKHGVEPTPDPDFLVMRGGTDTIDGLIASTERGILVTHFWYVRFVDPMTMLLTGMTRDGLFAIEDGKVTGGIKSFRWNMSTVDMLANVQGMTAAETTSDVEADPMVLPALKVADWNFTSPTTF